MWQITETHVHIGGHALLFKTIGEQEDEVKTEFRRCRARLRWSRRRRCRRPGMWRRGTGRTGEEASCGRPAVAARAFRGC